MGLSVKLQNENGESIEEVCDHKNYLHQLLPSIEDSSFQLLRFIDWYGDTVFNGLQIDVLIKQLDRIEQRAGNKEEKDLLKRIKHLALQCQIGTHLYLKFYGDYIGMGRGADGALHKLRIYSFL